ncbi:beta-hydroxylase [Sphingomonas gellani]|uniref:Beta-hydroxylase n=1 Tax=Sphingomonas gellani TaxID=1166340 RepID=A0A1H8FVF6_9SPHN|nr:aspartyl/asparaginyl beta-hydroxylase domain-containing protein [Sphingomonas gellani]SEN35247.1 beta-hydroxylase [Sphingomonas gellani]
MTTSAYPAAQRNRRPADGRDHARVGPDAPASRGIGGPVGVLLRDLLDRLIGASSLVPDAPVLDVRRFAWTAMLRENWRTIRDEAVTAIDRDGRAGGSPDAARCPVTAALIRRIPGLDDASFSVLAPDTHLHDRRGATKGLITCHLGLVVPRDGDVRMRVDDRIVRWAEGETLVFDDTYPHEVWNEARGERLVLAIRFARPLKRRGRWLAALQRRSRAAAQG